MQHELLEDPDATEVTATALRMPVGRAGQLQVLKRQLQWCDQTIAAARARVVDAMVDEDSDDSRRWAAVRGLRAVVHKIQRDILPLPDRVPVWLRTDPEYVECHRAAHALRRSAQAALREDANYSVDLISAQPLTAR